MFSAKDIINLKDVFYHQGSWKNYTSISIEGSKVGIKDESSVKKYVQMVGETISNSDSVCHVAKKETDHSFSSFQVLEKSCIAGHFPIEKPTSNIEIFSSHSLNLEEILKITQDYFNCENLSVSTYSKATA
ncbi:MAG TPA: hypothetical protein PK079_14060 [Leptospiraceae bacterium]|nr:hypothetical protein [Leptospiraceae bacterium]HMW08490.1 hypothetical protein [Leptospiraceae bacterium]HMX33330.1 hypothetical protein [Leptospiraceae bacterium]HMY34075.1 hypothetical protein [Leptospiraceae bacterium]HMZ64592.1 hypothetical protein [Leptospiraceae bacterium]